MATFSIKENDTSPNIIAYLKDEDSNAVDLTGASVKFLMKDPDSDTLKIDSSASIENTSSGKVKYTWSAGDTDTVGEYLAEWEVTYSGGAIETFPNSGYIIVKVLEELG